MKKNKNNNLNDFSQINIIIKEENINEKSQKKKSEVNNKNKQFENSFKRNHKEQEILKIDK